MTVAELIVELQKLPQGAPVQALNYKEANDELEHERGRLS